MRNSDQIKTFKCFFFSSIYHPKKEKILTHYYLNIYKAYKAVNMDIVLNFADKYFFDEFYALFFPLVQLHSNPTRDNGYRQFLSLFIITLFFAYFFYFFFSTLSYILVFDKELMKHQKFLKNQILKEIRLSIFV